MYKEYYGLNENPFSLTADVRFLYWSQTHQNAFRHLFYSIQSHKGLIVLAGEVGTGKTMLLHVLMEWVKSAEPKTRIAYVVHSTINFEDLSRYIFDEFNLELKSYSKVEYVLALKRFALHCAEQGERLMLILDEAQNYTADVLEEIRLLSNIETPQEKLLQIVLAGQPQLVNNINQPNIYQLKQRISVIYNLQHLSQSETKAYIQKRLDVAGAKGRSFFHDDAIAVIHHYAHGIPRVINLMCDHAFLYAYAANKKHVSRKIVEDVVADAGLSQEQPLRKTDDDVSHVEDDHADRLIIRYARSSLGKAPDPVATSDEPFARYGRWQSDRRRSTRSMKRSLFQLVGMSALLIGIWLGMPFVPWPSSGEKSLHDQKASITLPGTGTDNGHGVENQDSSQNLFDRETLFSKPTSERASLVRNYETRDDTVSSTRTPEDGEQHKVVVVKQGDTFREILLTEYGRYDQSLVSSVLEANPDIIDINMIFVGQPVRLPEH